eukprot:scaffold293_cov248-Pinguiococcus_pyrenoidosus.AAC.10
MVLTTAPASRTLRVPGGVQELQAALLRRQPRSATDSADTERRTGDRDVEPGSIAGVGMRSRAWVSVPTGRDGLHRREAMASLHHLSRILPAGEKHGCGHVRGVRVEPSDTAGDRAADQVLPHVRVHHRRDRGLEHVLHHARGENALRHHAMSAAFNPVDGRGLLVGAGVPTERQHLHAREPEAQAVQDRVHSFGAHVHAHGVTGVALEPQIDVPPGHLRGDMLERAVAGGAAERCHDRRASHARGSHDSRRAAAERDGLAASVDRGDQAPFRGGQGNAEQGAVHVQRPGKTDRNGHVSHDVLAVVTEDFVVLQTSGREIRADVRLRDERLPPQMHRLGIHVVGCVLLRQHDQLQRMRRQAAAPDPRNDLVVGHSRPLDGVQSHWRHRSCLEGPIWRAAVHEQLTGGDKSPKRARNRATCAEATGPWIS